jgi:hypothetical protein
MDNAGGDMDNAGFYTIYKLGIYTYMYVPGETPVHASVITECTVSAGPYTVISRR